MRLPIAVPSPLRVRETRSKAAAHADARGLELALKKRLQGEVRFDAGSRALYATDGSNYRQVPIGVVIPRTVADVLETVEQCRRFGAPIVPRGGGTSLAGQCCNVAVVIDFTKYLHRVLEVNPREKWALVQPGCVRDALDSAAAGYGLTFGPDPSTHNHCAIGGMIGNNSCGAHSVAWGKTSENVHELDLVLYDGTRLRVGKATEADFSAPGRHGEIFRAVRALRDRYLEQIRGMPRLPRRVSGFALDELLDENGFNVARALVGTEGTCGIVLQARMRLADRPRQRSLVVIGYPSVYEAADHVLEAVEAGAIACEGIDDILVDDMKTMRIHKPHYDLLPEGKGWLMVEFGGDSKEESDEKARAFMARVRGGPSTKLFDSQEEEHMLWKVRESGLGATAKVPGKPETWEGWEDSAVPPEKLSSYLRGLRSLFEKYGYGCALYGHFGQGCVHTRIDFDLRTSGGIGKFREFLYEAADLVVAHGGSLSGEHGDGQSKAELLPKMYGPELVRAFEEFKAIWDPDWKMNPGKVVKPYRADENLRLGAGYAPPEPEHHFAYAEDGGSFAQATLRCVGVGECRKMEQGTMCPSYMATREEMHSTRGRAHLLFEMLQGDPLNRVWREESVREALDLCLACKGCKGECPVNVDMATYKAEFLSHYYARRARPRHAYAMGLIYWWGRLASLAPRVVNYFSSNSLVKYLGNIAPQRQMPRFADETFRAWWARRPARVRTGRTVVLWPDTFTNNFHPDAGKAAVEVLEAAGFDVVVPSMSLCCGRPLYDFGMLDTARGLLRQTLDALREHIRAGTPLVGLEPSCVSVFRDELCGLYPHDEDAKRLAKQSFLLTEFLSREKWKPPHLDAEVLLHGHCHQKAILDFDAEKKLLEDTCSKVDVPDSGCCGMAGSFGFEKDHYEISQRIGEQRLLPAVRATKGLVVTSGFSCHEQIQQGTGKKPIHVAQLLQMAVRQGRALPEEAPPPRKLTARRVGVALAAAAAVTLIARAFTA